MRLGTYVMIAAGLALLGGAPAQAQSKGFYPQKPCGALLRDGSDAEKLMMAAWAFGFIAAKQNDARPVDLENAKIMLRNVAQVCKRDETRSVLSIVSASKPEDASVGGSKANAAQMLSNFLRPGADVAALTAELKPTDDEIAMVYGEELAAKLVPYYAELYSSGATVKGKPGNNAVIIHRATTKGLKDGEPVLRDFPGGYEQVRASLQGEYPIIHFKFVNKGEKSGMSYDGLIYINDRWVFMPKPWRVLD